VPRTDDHAKGHARRAVALRWGQVALLGVVVLLVGFRIWQREDGGVPGTVAFGLMAASALAVGVLERFRASAVKQSR
jgi:hypothetical protein